MHQYSTDCPSTKYKICEYFCDEKRSSNTDYLQVVKKHKIRSRQLDVTSHYEYLRATYICQKAFVERRLMFGLETREVSRGIESFARGIRKSKSET